MSETKNHIEHIDHAPRREMTVVTLTAEQFETLYMQPRSNRMDTSLTRRFGNPTPLGVSAFLLAHTPLAMDLLGFQGATSAAGAAMLGSFYACAGVGLYLAGIMEWVLGNTFPSVVFVTFGGFWTTYGITVSPSLAVAASFAPAGDSGNGITAAAAGAMSKEYNVGLGMYFLVWGILCTLYFIASLRTNVPFAIIFFSLIFAFELIAAGYFHAGHGNLAASAMDFKVAGGFAFVTSLAGFWVDASLLLAAVDFPVQIHTA